MAADEIARILEKLDQMSNRVLALEFHVKTLIDTSSQRDAGVDELRQSNSRLKLTMAVVGAALIGAGLGNIPTIAKLLASF
mgnify:CR=1 FL=1